MMSIWTSLLLVSVSVLCVSADFLMGGHLDNKKVTDDTLATSHLVLARTAEDSDMDLIAEESGSSVASTPYPDQEPRYKIPYAFAFNGGKPFSLEKDPITGKINFEKTPPLKALNLTEAYQNEEEEEDGTVDGENDDTARIDEGRPYGKIGYLDSKRVVSTNSKNERIGPNEINPYSPSFHDFLNLPVKYSSEKYERGDNYPLISSSYANTKVQSGSNSYNINNHRPYHQETATKVSISTATRKVYYPKSTTTTTIKPTISTTTTTTTTTTSPKPVEKKTTPVKPTKAPTTTTTTTAAPSTTTTTTTTTTTQTPSTQPKVTTWKPSKPSTTRYEEYEDMLPIEKIQGSKYDTPVKFGNYPMTDKDQNGHSNGPQSPPRVIVQTSYDYNDGYDDYDSSPEERPLVPPPPPPQQPVDHHHLRPHGPNPPPNRGTEIVQSIELEFPSTILPSTTNPPPTTTTPSTTTSGPVTSPSHYHNKQQPISGIHLTSDRPPMMVPIHLQPVTSMPLDYGNSGHPHVPPVHENFVESQRPVEFYSTNNAHNNVNNINNNNVGHSGVHFPGNMYGRPGSVISVLPESTSNVIVPHDQDTVSFVLGNRQNVEGSYYTHGTAMEEHPYAPNSNENNFRPIFGSGSSNVPGHDQKLSVALPSVAVVEPSISTSYNTHGWYNPSPNQGPVKSTPMADGDAQNTKTVQSSFVFPSPSGNENNNNNNNNNNKDAATQTDDAAAPGFVNFPDDGLKDRNDEHNQRPVEEHIIVINQADGSIKEITPNGSNNFADNAVVVNGGNNNGHPEGGNANNPNLPQLSESLTPPAEVRPSRPPPGGISQRPPYYFHYQHGGAPNSGKPLDYPPRPQRLPLPPRQKPEPPPVGFKRRPTPHDPKLPNILPQFRPNAKTSHGHRGTDKIGTLPAPQTYPPNRSRPPTPQSPPPHLHPSRRPQSHPPNSPPPPHFHRLSPPPPPQGHPPNSHPHHHNQQQQQQQQLPQVLRKKEDIGGPVAQLPPNPEHLKRFRPPVGGRLVVQKLRMEDEITGDRFSAEPPQVPPRPIIFPKNRADNQMPKVSTLQMIQQRGGLDDEIIRSNLPPLFKINRSDNKNVENDENSTSANEADRHKGLLGDSDAQDGSSASENGPVYVVYPVNSAVNIGSQEDTVEHDETVVIGTRGPHRPLPPDTLSLHDEDDIDRKDGEEGYYYGKRPQHVNNINGDYASQGYPIDRPESSHLIREKPLLIPSEDFDEDDSEDDHKPEESNSSDSSFNVISYLQDFLPFPTKKQQTATISATLPRLPIVASSSPIAYVYTPTTPSSLHRHDFHLGQDDDDDDFLHIDHRNEKPVLLPSQQPSSSSSSAPSPQNFMAPFVASVSAEMPPKNSWSVVGLQVNSTERTNDEKKGKEDKNVASEKIDGSSDSLENEAQTERVDSGDNFDPENFKPQLFGGFKPIYEFPVDEDDSTAMVGRGVISRSEVQVNADAGRKLDK